MVIPYLAGATCSMIKVAITTVADADQRPIVSVPESRKDRAVAVSN
jgi:hypothetical protein